ncbi:hypothetical protein HMPREF1292_01410, partial [Corynebacterium sp. KPL1995]
MGVNYASAQDANGEAQGATAVSEASNGLPTVQEAFDEHKTDIDARLDNHEDPVKIGNEVAAKYKERFVDTPEAFGQFEFQLERKVKDHFTERVQKNEIELGEQYKLPETAEKAFEKFKEKFKEQLIRSQDPEQVGKEIANQYRGSFERADGFNEDGYNKFEYEIEQETKKYFSTLVADGEVELDADFTTPSPKDYFESREKLIEAELRTPDGAIVENVEEVVNRHAELVYQQPGSNLQGEEGKAAWKDGFRPLVEVKKDRLELAARSAELKQQREELVAAAKELLPQIEELDKLNNDLQKQAENQNARESELDKREAGLKQQREELVAAARELLPQIEELDKLNDELEQKAQDQNVKESELNKLAEKLQKQQSDLVAAAKELLPQIEELDQLNNDLQKQAENQNARESELDEREAGLKQQREELVAAAKELLPQIEELDKL